MTPYSSIFLNEEEGLQNPLLNYKGRTACCKMTRLQALLLIYCKSSRTIWAATSLSSDFCRVFIQLSRWSHAVSHPQPQIRSSLHEWQITSTKLLLQWWHYICIIAPSLYVTLERLRYRYFKKWLACFDSNRLEEIFGSVVYVGEEQQHHKSFGHVYQKTLA